MKAFFWFLLLPLLTAQALAAPRVGSHDGFTRVVFDLPQKTSVSSTLSGQKFTVKLGLSLKKESGTLNAAGVSRYTVSGSQVTLQLAAGHSKAKASVLPASGGQPARLVIDVPTSAAAAAIPARPNGGSKPVIRPASSGGTARPRVIIDPGHGGTDPGMVSQWVREEDVTLDVGLRVRDLLRAKGVDVVMTRDADRHLSANKSLDLDARSKMAKTGSVMAYISIHVNAGNPAAEGIETYYFGQPIGGVNRSLAVLENGGGSIGAALTRRAASVAENAIGDIVAQAKLSFSKQLAQQVQASLLSATGAVNRGVHTDAFYVIRDPTTAAILTEIGFGSSTREGPLLATSAYRSRIASGIAQAILKFLHIN